MTTLTNRGKVLRVEGKFNPLNAELNPICHLLALLGAHHIFHLSGLRVKVIGEIESGIKKADMFAGI